MATMGRCQIRNRRWDICELEDGHEGNHWSLGSGLWSEALTVSGDSTHHYLSDEQGYVVDRKPVLLGTNYNTPPTGAEMVYRPRTD